MTSAARWVLSSTSAPTKKAGIVISRASPQTTMSFTPIDLDFILKLDWNIDKSLTKCLLSSDSFALQSYPAKKFRPATAPGCVPGPPRAVLPSLLPHPEPPAREWTDIQRSAHA